MRDERMSMAMRSLRTAETLSRYAAEDTESSDRARAVAANVRDAVGAALLAAGAVPAREDDGASVAAVRALDEEIAATQAQDRILAGRGFRPRQPREGGHTR